MRVLLRSRLLRGRLQALSGAAHAVEVVFLVEYARLHGRAAGRIVERWAGARRSAAMGGADASRISVSAAWAQTMANRSLPPLAATRKRGTSAVASSPSPKRPLITSLRGKVGRWIRMFSPALVDRIAGKAIRERK